MTNVAPLVGIGYRYPIHDWISAHLDRFDVLEVTVDHYLYGGPAMRAALEGLARRIPVVAHGVGLSLGTDAPCDDAYIREVARVVLLLGAPRYSEHLAFTKVPGLDLGNLLPLPKSAEVADWIAEKVRHVRSILPVPFDLENISYMFDWPDSSMSDGEFLRTVCATAGAGILLDVENVYVNSRNHGFDAYAALAEMPSELVHGMHMAGGTSAMELLVDSHDNVVPSGALDLLRRAATLFRPETVVLERDDRIDAFDEILADVGRIRACLAGHLVLAIEQSPPQYDRSPRVSVAEPLIDRQRALLDFLTDPHAAPDNARLGGLDNVGLRLVRDLSMGKRLEKVSAAFAVTLAHLEEETETLFTEFVVEFPPYDIGRAENAAQFFAFLTQRWEQTPPRNAYVRDLARVELALTLARRPYQDGAVAPGHGKRPAVRCTLGTQFLHCSHDVGPLFDQGPDAPEPASRPVWLVVLPPEPKDGDRGDVARVLEVSAEIYAALGALHEWRTLDGADPLGIGAPAHVAEHLLDLGLLEVAA